MTQRYCEELKRQAENGDRGAIGALRRAGVQIDTDYTEVEIPDVYDQSIPRQPVDKYVNKQVLPDWQTYRK